MLPVAVRTGLEPATPGVTGRYSNQLNYRTNCSDLCVFVERGCKGRYFFETCKLFSLFFEKKCKKCESRQKRGGKPGCTCRRSLFDFDHSFFVFHLLFGSLRNLYIKDSVIDVSFDRLLVCIVGEKQSLAEFGI